MVDRHSRLRPRPDVVHRPLAGGAVVLDLETGAYFQVNGVGALVWDLLDGVRDVAAVAAEVARRVEDVPPDAEADVLAFCAALVERGLVEVDPAPEAES